MRGLLLGSLVASVLFMSVGAALHAQATPAAKDDSKKEEPKKEEPKKVETPSPAPAPAKTAGRDESSGFMHYTLAAIGTIIIMILICMPLRRE